MPEFIQHSENIDQSPSWQVPVLYQIALCQEKLRNYVQATETYSLIEDFVTTVKEGKGRVSQ